jgi:hypothetical protein
VAVPAYIDQAKLTSRLGADAHTRLASAQGVLDAEATTRIGKACDDANALVYGKTAGLGIDTTTIPPELEDIAARLAQRALFKATWGSRGVVTPKSLEDSAKAAEDDLAKFVEGDGAVNGAVPARQVAAKFTWLDVGNDASCDNPRTTTRTKMRRLP